MILSSHLGVLDRLPKTTKKYIIMRWIPLELREKVESRDDIEWLSELSPDAEVLSAYRRGEIELKEVYLNIKHKFWNDLDVRLAYDRLAGEGKNTDIFILCCEEDDKECHRRMVGRLFDSMYDIPYTELR